MNGVPAYAGAVTNPMLLLAIESTRQYLGKSLPTRFAAGAGLPLHPGFNMPGIDTPAMLKRWQPDCRAVVLQFEAMSGLTWRPIKAAEGKGPAGEGGALDLLAGGVAKTLVEITRPDADVLKAQAEEVAKRAVERAMVKSEELHKRERIAEISVQVVPQFAFWSSVLPLHPDRMPRTLELMQLALDLAFVFEQRFKHAMAVPRPYEINPSVCPALLTPAHGSLPSGHATEAYTIATLMTALLGGDKATETCLLKLAQRIADNRQVAGLHYAIDTLAGQVLGTVLGGFLVARCRGGQVMPWAFQGDAIYDPSLACREDGKLRDELPVAAGKEPLDITRNEQLYWLWHEARLEWGAHPDEDKPGASAPPPTQSKV